MWGLYVDIYQSVCLGIVTFVILCVCARNIVCTEEAGTAAGADGGTAAGGDDAGGDTAGGGDAAGGGGDAAAPASNDTAPAGNDTAAAGGDDAAAAGGGAAAAAPAGPTTTTTTTTTTPHPLSLPCQCLGDAALLADPALTSNVLRVCRDHAPARVTSDGVGRVSERYRSQLQLELQTKFSEDWSCKITENAQPY